MRNIALQAALAATLVPVTIDGKTVLVDANSIDKFDRTVHHGKYKDTQVNSPATATIGGSLVIWPEANELEAFSMSKAAAGVLATQILEADGFTVTSKIKPPK